ncbi:MAG: 50S ribosomal protein L6 [Planctomycetes bacterium RBG_13_62_9]|nr:MAG: 50S ribosomal protein L6 [Planctomycetes bacterium RBG_13_62_9]
MSRIGKKPVEIPQGVKVDQQGQLLKVSGPQGALELRCHERIPVKVDAAQHRIEVVNPEPENRQCRELHGTMRALIANMVAGVSQGYERKMEIYGTGYSVKEQSGKLVLQVGFAHVVEVPIPKAVKVVIDVPATRGNDVPAKFTLRSADKACLGQFASDIRKVRPPEPYKGKGIRFAGEQIRRKAGKAFASGAA